MPSDLVQDPKDYAIHVRDRSGVDLPFSKGIMATSILATGLPTAVAHTIAADIARTLNQRGIREIDANRLADLAAESIEQSAGRDAAIRYTAWRQAKRAGHPIVICLGGAPGVGKSTIATRLALRLGINRVVPTDAIREVLRTVVPPTVLPELHVSTYECVGPPRDGDPSLLTFRRQAHAVVAASTAVAARLTCERRSVILEGAHLLPGEVARQLHARGSDAIVVELLLTVAHEDAHRAHLTHRKQREPGRGGDRHLNHLPVIRRLQDELRRLAGDADVAEHDIGHPEDLTQRIVDQLVRKVDAVEAHEEVAA